MGKTVNEVFIFTPRLNSQVSFAAVEAFRGIVYYQDDIGAHVTFARNILAIVLPSAILSLSPLAAAQDVPANEDRAQKTETRRIIIREPVPSIKNIHHVSATKTPSGFDVPRYVSLKYGKVNGRMGPSRNHTISWQYRRKGLPVIVVAETEMWRKVRDYKGDESWVYRGGLTGHRHVITLGEATLRKKPESDARRIAITQADMVLQLKSCEASWCHVIAPSGHQGWVKKSGLWGAETLR